MIRFDYSKVVDASDSTEVAVVTDHPKKFRKHFAAWLGSNFHVWREFERMCNRLWDVQHRTRYSASAIVYTIRLQTALHEVGGEWKINQNNARDLAMLYVLQYPARDALFEFRERADTLRCRGDAPATVTL